MRISIEEEIIRFNDDGIRYRYPNGYLDKKTVSAVLREWLLRLEGVTNGETVLLPYGIDDEHVDVFEAIHSGDVLTLTSVKTAGPGYFHGEDDPFEYMTTRWPVVERCESPFGRFQKEEFIAALRQVSVSTPP